MAIASQFPGEGCEFQRARAPGQDYQRQQHEPRPHLPLRGGCPLPPPPHLLLSSQKICVPIFTMLFRTGNLFFPFLGWIKTFWKLLSSLPRSSPELQWGKVSANTKIVLEEPAGGVRGGGGEGRCSCISICKLARVKKTGKAAILSFVVIIVI